MKRIERWPKTNKKKFWKISGWIQMEWISEPEFSLSFFNGSPTRRRLVVIYGGCSTSSCAHGTWLCIDWMLKPWHRSRVMVFPYYSRSQYCFCFPLFFFSTNINHRFHLLSPLHFFTADLCTYSCQSNTICKLDELPQLSNANITANAVLKACSSHQNISNNKNKSLS